MPSPVGHSLAGLSVAWSFAPLRSIRRLPPATRRQLVMTCAVLPLLPDLDILVGIHRGPAHSLGAALLVGGLAGAVAVGRRLPVTTVAAMCSLAYASHVLLDWLGRDRSSPSGLMALWPWSSAFYKSGLDLFLDVERRYWLVNAFVFDNLRAVAWELLLLLPVAALAWWMGAGKGRRDE